MVSAEIISMMISSAFAMLRVLLVSASGVLAAIYPRADSNGKESSLVRPLLHPDARRDIGRLCITLSWPCIAITSIGAAVHVEDLARVWPLLIWSCLQNLVALAICKSVTRFLCLDSVFEASFCLACCFGNSAALPMLMMNTLCNSDVLASRFPSDAECIAQSYASIMVFTAAWSIGMFGVAIPAIKRAAARADKARHHSEVFDSEQGGSLPGVESTTVIGSAQQEAAKIAEGRKARAPDISDEPWWQSVCTALRTPNIISVLLGLAVGLCQPLSDGLFRQPGALRTVGGAIQTLAEPGVCGMTLVMAASLIPAGSAEDQKRPPLRVVLALCLLRLVVIPAVGFALVLAVMRAGILPRVDAAQWLIVFVQWAAPSSQTAVVVLATLQMHGLAQKLASTYVFMYPLSVVTLTGWTTLALYLVREHVAL